MANGFRSSYIAAVERMAIGGYSTNAEIASVLGKTEQTISRWRRAVPRFNAACEQTLMLANCEVANFTFQRAREDDTMARYWNDRRNPAFMPKAKHDHVSNGNTLKALLAEHGHMDEDEARERGLIIDAEDWQEVRGGEDAGHARLAPGEAYDEADELDDYDEDGRPLR